MRIEEYMRELVGTGFTVVGSNIRRYSDQSDCDCDPIRMSLTMCDNGMGEARPDGDSLDTLLEFAQVNSSNEEADDEDTEFEKHFAEIFHDEHPNWQLGEFSIHLGAITLWYGNIMTQSTGSIRIRGAQNLRLTFRTARTRLGFDPVYHVRIQYDEHGQHKCTEVEENLGYMRRFINFEAEGQDSDIVHITEFVGM